MVGVPANRFVDSPFVETCLNNICEKATQLEIIDDVFKLTQTYLEEHPEAAEAIKNQMNTDFQTLINKIIQKRSEVWTASEGYSEQSAKSADRTEFSARDDSQSTRPNDFVDNVVTSPINVSSESRLLAYSQKKKTSPENKNNVSDKTSVPGRNTSETGSEKVQSSKTTSAESKKAMQAGVKEYLEYEKENKIGLIESCINILNYSQADKDLKELALTRFKTLISKSNQEVIFKSRLSKTSGQIAVEEIMDTDVLASINTFSSSYAKEYAEKRLSKET